MTDIAYLESRFVPPEIPHRYGKQVHLLDDPLAWSQLARLSALETGQPQVGRLVRALYERLAQVVLAAEFPRGRIDVPTRMVASSPEAVYRGLALAPATKAVTVGIARAGTMPSQVVYDRLNEVLDPAGVRQDHLFMSRAVDAKGSVTGATWHDAKIGRDVEGRIIVFPDPMGATGSSMNSALSHYKTRLDGKPSVCITMHLIITPEYLQERPRRAPGDDRLRPPPRPWPERPDVLGTVPGTRWKEERGLDEHQYIVPGAGGVGELLNNAWV